VDYPLERVVPERVFDVYDDESDGRSNESVHVFTNPPEQQPHEEARTTRKWTATQLFQQANNPCCETYG
jgi:hypothetical protein